MEFITAFEKEEGNEESDEENNEPLALSAETIAALKSFALSSGIPSMQDTDIEGSNVLDVVRDHYEVKNREKEFDIDYTSADGERSIHFTVNGVKRQLGQTLSSTGLTIWRASEHLCEFVINNPQIFVDKSVCELGCGLGMVSILLDKMGVCESIIATDGDDDTMDLLRENIKTTGSTIQATKVYWGKDLNGFKETFPTGFDIVIAADVVYEEEQAIPLIETVVKILKENATSEFLLAFARRNVPIDLVLTEAEKRGLEWEILDAGEGGLEPIYRIFWKKFSVQKE
mmetsp:Transcript_19596/g.18933  ORF Transcript_19596/g.18933 Transcript_19596/m.18933 type:complete len:286 (-) Transcript_19596:470-1327(-)|eukprot:CAMPEP_0119033628 /NCGR_PEP_ID=MMETSP1177-20130426/677_1 /TAXON_ID=2985 /ORGANISM="Ochromonas sp, Strain CCMP1899" /LENGTH=285 /DNA_ID=CAMNT_0006990513 /DNA_START=110 /DNA_END=967 /DNA_ORIENTATION=+